MCIATFLRYTSIRWEAINHGEYRKTSVSVTVQSADWAETFGREPLLIPVRETPGCAGRSCGTRAVVRPAGVPVCQVVADGACAWCLVPVHPKKSVRGT